MGKDKEMTQEKKTQNNRLKMTFAIVILAALFIVELYFMLNRSTNYLLLGVIGLVMLCFVYWITDLSFKIHNERDTRMEKEYEKIYKSAKVCYTFLRKSVLELSNRLDEIDEDSSMPIDELIDAQKAIAKVTINRSKENANAMMNSNDKLLDKMFEFEGKLQELDNKIQSGSNGSEFEKVSQSIEEKQQELLSLIREVEESLKGELAQTSNALQAKMSIIPESDTTIVKEPEIIEKNIVQEPMTSMVEEDSEMDEMPISEEAPVTEEVSIPEEATAEEEMPVAEEITVEEEMPVAEEVSVEEEMPVAEEVPAEEEMPVAEPVLESETMSVEDIEKLLQEAPDELETDTSESVVEEPIAEEPVVEEMKVEEPAVEDPVIEEPVIEQADATSDLNHVMTPEEIAKLLGDIGGEEEKTEEPEPVAEEKSTMPDVSDPGHVMTPEEIAAMLANM